MLALRKANLIVFPIGLVMRKYYRDRPYLACGAPWERLSAGVQQSLNCALQLGGESQTSMNPNLAPAGKLEDSGGRS